MANLTTEGLQAQLRELQIKNYKKLIASLKVLNPSKTDEQIVEIYADQAKEAKKAEREAAKKAKEAEKAAKAAKAE